MKNEIKIHCKTIATLIVFITISSLFAQQSINYKALIKDNTGNVVTNNLIQVQFTILQGVALTNVYQETHSPTTNANGIVILNIGEGTTNDVFTNIDWATDEHFLNVHIDTGNGLTDMGTTQFMAVPYAIFSKTADRLTNIDNFSWSTTGNDGTDAASNYIGTTDDQPLIFKVNNLQAGRIPSTGGSNTFYGLAAGVSSLGIFNTAIGHQALSYTNTGNYNTATGYAALRSNISGAGNVAFGRSTLLRNTSGNGNSAIGDVSLSSNITGNYNTAFGNNALRNNTQSNNTAIGYKSLYSNTIGVANSAVGLESLYSNISGNQNTGIGYKALYSNINGHWNIALGSGALQNNISGSMNTSIGFTALYNNTTGSDNTAIGRTALFSNLVGYGNTAIGKSALYFNSSGYKNTATGRSSLQENTIGEENTANGFEALKSNSTGNQNTAIGNNSLANNTIGNQNTAIGHRALASNTGGIQNTAAGNNALASNNTGDYNTAIGYRALAASTFSSYNTAVGYNALSALTEGHWNTAIGREALWFQTSGYNNIGIGYHALVPSSSGSNQIRMGNTQMSYAGIQIPWSTTSDKRWKDNIRELPYGLNMVMQLQPVDYVRKNNDKKTREMGFVAQDVESLLIKLGYTNQGFLTKDDNDYISLRYNDFIAVLTKAIQEQQEIIKVQQIRVAKLERDMEALKLMLIQTNKHNLPKSDKN